jgi:hypothetical protein
MSEENKGHLGTKFLGFMIGLALAVIRTLVITFKENFSMFLDYQEIAFTWVFFVIVIPIIVFLAEIIWRYFHAYSEKLPVT